MLTLKAKLSKAISGTLLALATFTFLFLATSFLFEDSVKFWQGFRQNQVMAGTTSDRAAGDTHWYLVERWISERVSKS